MPLSRRSTGRYVQNYGAPTNTLVDVATSRCLKWCASIPSGLGTIGAARAATRATETGRSLRGSYVRNCRGQNPESSTTSRRARVSNVRRPTGCRLCGEPLAQAAGSRGTGCVHGARPGLWGGRRVTGAFTRNLTASSLRCAAVVHAASPSQMGRMQRTSLGQRLPSTRKGEGTRACRPSRARSEDAATVARRDPRDLAQALLPAVQCPLVKGGPRAPASQRQGAASPGPAEGRGDR